MAYLSGTRRLDCVWGKMSFTCADVLEIDSLYIVEVWPIDTVDDVVESIMANERTAGARRHHIGQDVHMFRCSAFL